MLPAFAAVGSGPTGLHREHSIQQQDTLFEPRGEIAAGGRADAEIGVEFGVDVLQRSGDRAYVCRCREGQAYRMPRGGVGILAHNQDLHLAHWATESTQHLISGWQVASASGQLRPQEPPDLSNRLATGRSASAQSWLTSSLSG